MGLLYNLADPEFEYLPTDWLEPPFFVQKQEKKTQMQRIDDSTTVMVTSRTRREKHILLNNVVEKKKKEIKEKVSLEIEHQRSWLREDDFSVVQSKRRSFLHGYLK